MFSVRVNFTLGHVDVHVDVQTHWFAILPLPHTFFFGSYVEDQLTLYV